MLRDISFIQKKYLNLFSVCVWIMEVGAVRESSFGTGCPDVLSAGGGGVASDAALFTQGFMGELHSQPGQT